MFYRRLIVLPMLCLIAVCPVLADAAPETNTLTLTEAQQLWREHNRELKLARGAVVAAEADVTSAGAVPNPQLSINTASIPAQNYGSGGWRNKRIDNVFRLEQLIERGNKRELRQQTAESLLEASRHDLGDTERSQGLVLAQAYFDLLLAQDRLRLSSESADLYRNTLKAMDLRLRAGDVAPIDVSRVRVDAQRADNDARQARADHEKAQVTLAYLLGREKQARSLVAKDEWPALVADLPPAATMLAERADVRAAQARVVAAERAAELARAQKTRDVTVGVQFEHCLSTSCNAPANTYGVGVSVPLFVNYAFEGEIRRAEADLQTARDQYEQVLAQAEGDLDRARSDVAAAQERRQRLDQELLADAARVASASEFAYAKGAASLMDLLDARRTLRAVQLEAAAARADYAKALAAWQAANGK